MTHTAALTEAKSLLLAPFDLGESDLERVFGDILGHRVDYADLYFQYSRSEAWSLDEGIVKSGSFNIDQGVGVRAVAGHAVGSLARVQPHSRSAGRHHGGGAAGALLRLRVPRPVVVARARHGHGDAGGLHDLVDPSRAVALLRRVVTGEVEAYGQRGILEVQVAGLLVLVAGAVVACSSSEAEKT